jgi:hypothetical protein
MNQFFDTIGGLPLHPLTVHAASVLIPLSAIALVLLVFVPKWRKAYLPLTVGALAVSVGLAFAAKQSGEALLRELETRPITKHSETYCSLLRLDCLP